MYDCFLSSQAMSLELATLKQKLSAWQEEVERLTPLQERVDQLVGDLAQAQSVHEGLYQQIQQLEDDLEKSQRELAEKVLENNTLNERFVELQKTRVNLENELGPLREERATILRENAHLLEGSDPKKYANLKKENEDLKTHCQQLELALEEQSNLLSAHQESNVEMQQQLEKATDAERLQSIRERMERYKQERDTARSRVEEVERQLVVSQSEKENLLSELEEASNQSERCLNELQQLMVQREKSLLKSAEFEKRMRRYRDERNQASTNNLVLRQQVATLEGALNDLLAQTGREDTASYLQSLAEDLESMDVGGAERTSEQEQEQEPVPKEFQSGSPGADEYHPHHYSTDEDQHEYGSHGERDNYDSPLDHKARVQGGDVTDEEKSHLSKVKGSLERPKTSLHNVEVLTKEGLVHLNLQKPHSPLNVKDKPVVIVKKGEGVYETGTLLYVGYHGGKEIAGMHMSIRQSSEFSLSCVFVCLLCLYHILYQGVSGTSTFTDGTYSKDGKRHFKW